MNELDQKKSSKTRDEAKKNLSVLLKFLLKGKLTQTRLGELLNVPKGRVNNWCSVNPIPEKYYPQLAEALGIDPTALRDAFLEAESTDHEIDKAGAIAILDTHGIGASAPAKKIKSEEEKPNIGWQTDISDEELEQLISKHICRISISFC